MTPAIWNNQAKAGYGWVYDQGGLEYDAILDNLSGNPVFYDAAGQATVWTNDQKS